MKKLENKDIVQHYLLNLFTILNVELSTLGINNNKEKKKIEDLVNTASVIIANENIFLGEKPNFFYQDLSLNNTILLVGTILSNEIESNTIEFSYPKEDIIIKVDKYYFGEALKYFFQRIIQKSKLIKVSINRKNRAMMVEHNSDSSLRIEDIPLTDILKKDNISYNKMLFQLSMEILKLLSIKIFQEENLIVLLV